MGTVLNVNGFRCVNHSPDREAIMVGRFDLDNPCSWCLNRKHSGRPSTAFHYVEYGRWEFPFVAEANCTNFSMIETSSNKNVAPGVWKAARAVDRDRERINKIGVEFAREFSAFDSAHMPPIGGRMPKGGSVTYPDGMEAANFFREVSDLRSEFFEMKHLLAAQHREFLRRTGLRDTRLEKWLDYHSQRFGELSSLIDKLESMNRPSGLAVVSRFAVNTIAGGAAWDSLKWVRSVVAEVLRSRS